MTAEDIKYFLRLKYSKTWAFYEEFRPFTGSAGNVNQIDAVAFGLYEKNKKIIAFEIKTDRADFLKDVSMFNHKHRFALELSNEFYYVCPWDLIDKSEVPDVVGLLYINKGHKIQTKKVAQLKVRDSLPFHYIQAFLQNSKKRISYADIPVQYLGRNWTQKDFLEKIDKTVEEKLKWRFDSDVEKVVNEKLKKENSIHVKFQEILREAGLSYRHKKHPEDAIKQLIEMIKIGYKLEKIKDRFEFLKSEIYRIDSIFQEKAK